MFFSPIVSMFILTIGNGFFTTLTTIQLNNLAASNGLIGIISAAYFAGMLTGAYCAQRLIVRVGYIRAYALFASLLATISLLQGLTDNTLIWLIARYICGYCMTALFIVIENWCLESSAPKIKGFIFAFYLFSYYLAQSIGQLFLKMHYSTILVPFCIIAGSASLSVIPVCFTRFNAPDLKPPKTFSPITYFKQVPLGIAGGMIAGLILSGIYTLLPLTFQKLHFSVEDVGYLMGLTFLGGTIFQLPIGRLSDLYDRRIILILINALCVLFSLLLLFMHTFFWKTMFLAFLLGGCAFAIYPLSISHATDYTDKADTIAVLSTMSLSYGIGSTIGPIIIANLMSLMGNTSIFIFNIAVCLGLLSYAILRCLKRENVSMSEKAHFVGTTQEMVVGAEHSLDNQLNQGN